MNYKIAPTYYTRLLRVLANIAPGRRLLNAGCGTGEFNHYLRHRFESSVGIDINAGDIATADGLNRDPNILFEVANLTSLPFEAGSFDAAICVDVLEHVGDAPGAVAELRRVLEPGGQLVVTVPHRNYPFFYDPVNFVAERTVGRHFPIGIWGFGHTRLFGEDQLRDLVRGSGFEIESTEYLTHGLAGLLEGYLPTLLQPLFKSNAKNQVEASSAGGGEAFWRFSYEIPQVPAWALEKVIDLDRRMAGRSERSVGLLMRCRAI
jgi:SAM-dependent methyltransferase